MAKFQLEDLLKDDKKDVNLIPDLSKATCNSEEEFHRLMECCPDFKIKPEKIKREDIKIRDKDFTWKTTKKELRSLRKEWNYSNPIPPDMRTLNIQELYQVPIDWRMLTSLRPKLRQDEEMFSRLVEVGKLQVKMQARERRSLISSIRRGKNRAGIVESSIRICNDCGEEFCCGEACGDILYDAFIRVTVTPNHTKVNPSTNTTAILSGISTGRTDTSSKKKRKHPSENKNVKTAKLCMRKIKVNKTGAKKKDKQIIENKKDVVNCVPQFRRMCTKYRAKKNSPTPCKT